MTTDHSVPRPCKGQQVDSTGGEGSKHPYGFRKLLDDIKAQVPIETVADDLGAGLKPNGKGLRGRGVDHGGDNPTSLMVWPETGRWHCFRCNEGGDLLDLWMKAKDIRDAMDGIMDLAGSYGVEPTPRPNFGRRQERQKPVRDELEEVKIHSAHRRLYRIFVRNTISLIEDEDERREEAKKIWDELAPVARMVVARGGVGVVADRHEEALQIAGFPPARGGQGGFKTTDLGNAERFAYQHGEVVRYCRPWGGWLVYDRRWQKDRTGAIERKAKTTARSIYAEAANPELDSAEAKALASHAARSEAKNRIDAMIALAGSEPGIPVLPEELDADPYLLNCLNGTVDLRTGRLREHHPEDLLMKMAGTEYDPDAQAPIFEGFLRTVLPSEALRKFVQKFVGYSLTGDVSEQILAIAHGPGANGKSTLSNAVLEMMGDYGMQAAPDLLLSKKGAHPTELADLQGARLASSVEVEDGRRLAESLVKQLTGGDRIKARFMHQDFFEFDPTHKVWLAANHKPVIHGTDHAIWRRIRLIPFDVIIPKAEQDPRLPEKLRNELPGILAWAVEGCQAWQREGLGEPDEVREATQGYREEQDVLAAFFEECCVFGEGAWAPFKDLYAAYVEWAGESGEKPENKRRFSNHLDERGFENARGAKNVAIRKGIGLLRDGGLLDEG